MTTTEENKATVRQEFETAWIEKNLDDLDRFYAEDLSIATVRSGSEDDLIDASDLKNLIREWQEAFPDASMEINELVAEDDKVLAWWTIRGTHQGPFRGIEPTGNEIDVEGFSFRRLRDGKIVETKSAAGLAGLLEQLGVELPLQT